METNLISAFDLLKNAWGMYKKHAWFFVKAMGVLFGLIIIFGLIAGGVGGFFFLDALFTGGSVAPLIIGVLILVIFLIYLASAWNAGLIRFIATEEKKSVWSLFGKENRRYAWKLFGLNLLLGIITAVGLILFIVPGLIFLTWFAFGLFFLVLENKGIMESFSESKKLSKGRVGKVLWRLVCIFLVQIVASIVVAIVQTVLGEGVGNILNIALSFVLTPLAMIYLYGLYKNLKGGESAPVVVEETVIEATVVETV